MWVYYIKYFEVSEKIENFIKKSYVLIFLLRKIFKYLLDFIKRFKGIYNSK